MPATKASAQEPVQIQEGSFEIMRYATVVAALAITRESHSSARFHLRSEAFLMLGHGYSLTWRRFSLLLILGSILQPVADNFVLQSAAADPEMLRRFFSI